MPKVKSEFKVDENGNPTGGQTSGVGFLIRWQDGTIGPEGPNGASMEDAVDAVIQRLEFLNTAAGGRFKCMENERALQDLRNARRWMDVRTAARKRRGVEGSYRP